MAFKTADASGRVRSSIATDAAVNGGSGIVASSLGAAYTNIFQKMRVEKN